MRYLVTGVAGFIGNAIAQALLQRQNEVIGIDSLNAYYDPKLKTDRLQLLENNNHFRFIQLDLVDCESLQKLFSQEKFTHVIHMAAQAGVRYSLENPHSYIDNNIIASLNILESCRYHPVTHLVYASSSSVYGLNSKVPFSVNDPANHPVSLYAATKKSTELMAHTYSHLFDIPTTGLRFFTVYGPWGRPDMAPMKFAHAIYHRLPIDVYNYGDLQRDFTYIDDIVTGVMKIIDQPPKTLYNLYNIGNHRPVKLLDFIDLMERTIGIPAKKNMMAMQPGDVYQTMANVDELKRDFGFQPNTDLVTGIQKFIAWYKDYYHLN